MTPAPATILGCPFCGGEKKVMSIASGNTYGGTVWSDTRRRYPMLPEVSAIQKCPHCGKYYFIDQASHRMADWDEYSGELGHLNYEELREAKQQLDSLTLTDLQRWMLDHMLFLAHNDRFHRCKSKDRREPDEEEKALFYETVGRLLQGIHRGRDYRLFEAELLREGGRFDEAALALKDQDFGDDAWIADKMMRHIERRDTRPFLLIENGIPLKDEKE